MLQLETVASAVLTPDVRAEILALIERTFDEELDAYLSACTPGWHWLGRVDGELVAHGLIYERWLQPEGRDALRTAYVELVAVAPEAQRRGHGSRVMRAIAAALLAPDAHGEARPPRSPEAQYELAALAPASVEYYARLGWALWRGPLGVRRGGGVEPTPDERAMILRLPATPSDLDPTRALSIEWRAGEVW